MLEQFAPGRRFEREILIALQPDACVRHGAYPYDWLAVAKAVQASPPSWRWWVRRHPEPMGMENIPASQWEKITQCDDLYPELLALANGSNVRVSTSAHVMEAHPIDSFLPHMDCHISMSSMSTLRAAVWGCPSFLVNWVLVNHTTGRTNRKLERLAAAWATPMEPSDLVRAIAALPAFAPRQPDYSRDPRTWEQCCS